MTTTLQHEFVYDARLGDVAAMLSDPAFRERVADAQGALRRSVSVGGTPREVHIRLLQSTAAVPAFAKRVVSGEVSVHYREVWSSDSVAVVETSLPGGIATIRGNTTLSEAGGKTTQSIRLQISVKVPLVSARLEKLIEDMMRNAYDVEHRVGVEYLAG